MKKKTYRFEERSLKLPNLYHLDACRQGEIFIEIKRNILAKANQDLITEKSIRRKKKWKRKIMLLKQ